MISRKLLFMKENLDVFGSCEHHSKSTKEMNMPLRPTPKWDTICCSEPGIRRENKDSCGNEIRKSQNKIFSMAKNRQAYIFFSMKIKMMDLLMQIEGGKFIFIMNFRVLDFFKFASRMPQIAQILVSTFKIFSGGWRGCGGGGGGGGGHAPGPPRYFLFFYL